MQNKYLSANTKVIVNNKIGHTVGFTRYSTVDIIVELQENKEIKSFLRSDVELYVAPRKTRKLFKDVKSSKGEKLMARLLQATTHENVVKTALESVDPINNQHFTVKHSPAHATSKWTLLTPTNLSVTEKIPVFIAHTDLHPSLQHPTINNLEYENDTFTSPTGLGADDRAGIFAITQLLPHISYMPFAVLFPDEEEIGLLGTHAFTTTQDFRDLDKQVSMYISIDRRRNPNGKATLAIYGKDNNNLNKVVSKLLNRSIIKGSSTDCRALSVASAKKVPCFNLSCGYEKEHTENEILYFKELEKTVTDLMTLLSDSSIVNKEYKIDPIKHTSCTYNLNTQQYNELDDSIIINGE